MIATNSISATLDVLAQGPSLLRDLLSGIPREIFKARRIPSKWTIHEHVCHLAISQKMLAERFKRFKTEEHPAFVPYIPGKTVSEGDLHSMDFDEALKNFEAARTELVEFLKTFTEHDWRKSASHPEYHEYGARILLRHLMMHDHLHMYRIEELWLTKDEYLNK